MTGRRIKEITSHANPAIKAVKALHLKKRRDETGLFVAEGARVIQEAIARGLLPETLIISEAGADRTSLSRLCAQTLAAGKDVLSVTPQILEKIARRDNPQSVIALFRQERRGAKDLPAMPQGTLIALENIKDPGNLGTILRTADATGSAGVLLIGDTCDPYSPEAVRATMGSLFAVPLYRLSLAEFVAYATHFKGDIIGTALQTDKDYRAITPRAPTLLLMGSEQAGLSAEARLACTHLVKLPMRGGADSLNLAVATGVMLYHLLAEAAGPPIRKGQR